MNDNGKKLLDKMSDIDPKLIADADKKPFKKRGLFIGLASGMATAAAAAVIAVAAVNAPVQDPPVVDSGGQSSVSSTNSTASASSGTSSAQEPPAVKDPPVLDFSKYKGLPKITDGDYGTNAMGGAKEAYLNYSELETGSPWKGAELETMPVYMSSSTCVDLDKMYEYIKNAAAALGIPESELEFTDTYPDMGWKDYHRKLMEDAGLTEDEIQKEFDRMSRQVVGMTVVTAKTGDIEFELDSSFSLSITFGGPVELPEGYNFTDDASAEEKAGVLSYLADKYKDISGYSKPVPGYTWEYINFTVYDSDCELERQIVNYWTEYAEFHDSSDEPGKLSKLRIHSLAGCEKLGDYPILTPDQAVQILRSNKYSDKDRMPADAKILKTDIVYNNHAGSTAVMPYYKFYVETGKETYFGKEVTCDVYTIAAVPEEFIEIETRDYGVYA